MSLDRTAQSAAANRAAAIAIGLSAAAAADLVAASERAGLGPLPGMALGLLYGLAAAAMTLSIMPREARE
jgi:enoyl-CoA hydratase/carnithine racemase